MLLFVLHRTWFYGERKTGFPAITAPQLQIIKQTLITLKHATEFTYSDFRCHLKVDRDKLALINHWSKCIKGKGWQLHVPLVHSQKSTNMTISPMLCPAVTVVGEENPNHAKNQSDCKIRYRALLGKIIYTVPSKQKSEILFEVTSTCVWLKHDICSMCVRFANYRDRPEVVASG